MPREIVIKRSVLMTALAILASLGVMAFIANLPEIRREIKIWMM